MVRTIMSIMAKRLPGVAPPVLLFGGLLHKIWPGKVLNRTGMSGPKNGVFGLIGTITHDDITSASGRAFRGLGGILYQAAALSGLGKRVFLYTNLGRDLLSDVKMILARWPSCRRRGIHAVPGPGNRVFLYYPGRGERIEVLESHVPPLNPTPVIEELPRLALLVLVINSGYDIRLPDWRRIVRKARCPIWFDVHSLALSRNLHSPRYYRPLPEWKDWAEGVTYLQANSKEVAAMTGEPAARPSRERIESFGRSAFRLGIKAVVLTMGKGGALLLTPQAAYRIRSPQAGRVVDTTGCGDVLGAVTAAELVSGADLLRAASRGMELASDAVRVSGVEETYNLVRRRAASFASLLG
jgi:sugar/nucleoside kinase (ribokinase family)